MNARRLGDNRAISDLPRTAHRAFRGPGPPARVRGLTWSAPSTRHGAAPRPGEAAATDRGSPGPRGDVPASEGDQPPGGPGSRRCVVSRDQAQPGGDEEVRPRLEP